MPYITLRKEPTMSLYYSPQLVKLLTEERLREAADARRQHSYRTPARPSRVSGMVDRIFSSRATPSTCSC
jgi:hypothetical protein